MRKSVVSAVSLLAMVVCAPVDASGQSAPVPVRTAAQLPPIVETYEHEMVAPPFVPAPITRKHAAKVIVNLETVEKTMELADGVTYEFWTFGGQVPGNFLRVREGDLVEFRMTNAHDSKVPHNIDLHAVTGQGGGAAASMAVPGESKTFTFRALNPGLYVYHCATGPIPQHIANGMYGLILVEPEEGLPAVDREFYVMQGDFYTEGATNDPGHQAFSWEKLMREDADYVVFNGRVGSLTGDRVMKANVGETVRLFVGNGGPNLVSSFHVIGEVFDDVYKEGGSAVSHNIQTTLVPAGGAALVEFGLDVPGDFILVDHSIVRATNKGALGILRAEGKEVREIFHGEGEGSGH